MPDHSNDQGTADRGAIDRLQCPSCGVGFAIPKDLDKCKGKRTKCRVCAAPVRFAADGLSLTAISDETPAPTPPLVAEPVPEAPPADPLGNTFPGIDLAADRPPRDEPAVPRSVLPWAIAGVALVVALVPTVWLALGSSRREGTIQLELESPVADVALAVDGQPVPLEQLKAPLTLPVGPHRLEASGRGLVAFQGILPVFEGANPPFPVKLAAVPKPVEVAVAPPRGGGASKAEPPPAAAAKAEVADAQAADGAVEVAGDMAAEKVEADPAVVGELPAERVEADPAVVGDMAADKVEADPGILGAEPKAGPRANVTLKQVAADPADYLDAAVIPADLLLVDTGAIGGAAGRRAGALNLHLVVKSRDGAYRDFVKPSTPLEILVTTELAAAIRDQVRAGNLVGGEYPAIVKFKITPDPKNPQGFVGLVEWVELLVYVDPRPIFNGKSLYNKVFTVMRVGDGGAQLGLSKSYAEWHKRLVSTSVLTKLKIAYRQAFTINRGVEYDQLAQLVRTKLPANSKMLHDKLMSLLRGR